MKYQLHKIGKKKKEQCTIASKLTFLTPKANFAYSNYYDSDNRNSV